MKKLVLFDIDGTLVRSKGAGRSAIQRTLLDMFGTAGPIDGFRFDGKTDPQIVRELLIAAGHPDAKDAVCIQRACDLYVSLLREELATDRGMVWVLDGVLDLLDALTRRTDSLVGLLTGNIEQGARLKLAKAGLDWDRFRVGAFGSDAEDRGHLPPVAVARATSLMGRVPAGDDVVIIGDTPADVSCGESVGARALAVATGFFSVEELNETEAFRVFETLADTDGVLNAIFA
jgi:phosphoglycolate phosphatase